MPEGSVTAATRSAFLELKDEQSLIQEGYDLLDQESILIAAEVLRQLADYRACFERYLAEHRRALEALARASGRLGFDELTVYPPTALSSVTLQRQSREFLGVTLDEVNLAIEPDPRKAARPVYASSEAEDCATHYGGLTAMSAELGAKAGNLRRLCTKYIETERRANALENVLLPEITQALKFISEKLEEVEQEDVIRVRTRTGTAAAGRPLGSAVTPSADPEPRPGGEP